MVWYIFIFSYYHKVKKHNLNSLETNYMFLLCYRYITWRLKLIPGGCVTQEKETREVYSRSVRSKIRGCYQWGSWDTMLAHGSCARNITRWVTNYFIVLVKNFSSLALKIEEKFSVMETLISFSKEYWPDPTFWTRLVINMLAFVLYNCDMK